MNRCFLTRSTETVRTSVKLSDDPVIDPVTDWINQLLLILLLRGSIGFITVCVVRFDRIAHTRETMYKDGINSLSYKVVKTEKFDLFTKITVDVGKP